MPRQVPAARPVREAGSHGVGAMLGEACSWCWAHTGLLWAPGNPLKMLIIESTLICINYANQAAVAHRCGLGGSLLYLKLQVGLAQVLFTTINGFAVECLESSW